MRKLLVSTLMLSALLGAAPAAAQYYGDRDYRGDRDYGDYRGDDYRYRGGGDYRFDRQIDQLVDRIRRAEDRDMISQREEDRLLRQARQLNYLERRYGYNGYTRWEAQDMQQRIANLRAQFRWERQDGRYSSRW